MKQKYKELFIALPTTFLVGFLFFKAFTISSKINWIDVVEPVLMSLVVFIIMSVIIIWKAK